MADGPESNGLNMTEGSPFWLLMKFSLPLLAGNALQQMYNLADSAVAGNFIGTTALSAVSNGYIVLLMITTLFSGVGAGGTVVIAQFFGQGNQDGIRRTVETIYFGIAVVFLPLTLMGWFGAQPILALFQVPMEVLPAAVTYVKLISLGFLGVLGYNINAGILNGLGDSRSSLKFLALSCVTNISMDLLFVVVFHMEIEGTALATVLSQFLSWWLGVWHINRRYPYIRLRIFSNPLDLKLLKQILLIGIPSAISSLQYTVGVMLIQSLINSFGAAFIAGISAATRLEGFSYMPILSFSSAITTYAAQNTGAKRPDRIQDGVRVSVLTLGAICLVLAALIVPLGRPLCRLLFGIEEAALDASAAYLLQAMAPSVLLGTLYIINSALRGTGNVLLPTLSGIIALWIVRVPTAYYLALHYGPYQMFFSFPIGWICGLLISGTYYFSGRWKQKSK